MPQIDSYTAGTVSLTNGSAAVNGVGTNWMSGTANYSVLAGHLFVCGTFFAPVLSVTAAGQLTLAIPFTGATASGLAYRIFRYTWVETAAVMGFLQALMDRGSKTKPVPRWDIDSGAMTMSLRQDDAGNPALYVGGAGAADGSMVKALQFDRTSGAMYLLGGSARLGIGTSIPSDLLHAVGVAAPTGTTKFGFRATTTGTEYGAAFQGYIQQGIGAGASISTVSSGGVTERLRINQAGSVGIGTDSPGAQLDVAGDARIGGSINVSDQAFVYTSYNGATVTAAVRAGFQMDGANQWIKAYTGNTLRFYVTDLGHFLPGGDNGNQLGSATARWQVLFAGTGTINTSDAALKHVRGEPSDAEMDAWGRVRPKIYRFLDAVAAKGDEARLHTGWIAQEVAGAFEAEGLDPARMALFCRDAITRQEIITETKRIQAVDDVEEPYNEIEIRDGVPTQVRKTRLVKVPRVVMTPIVDDMGVPVTEWVADAQGTVMQGGINGKMAPVLHPVPVMIDEEREVETEVSDGDRLGLRYEECLVMEAAWSRREMTRLHTSIAALTARVTALEPTAA